MKKYLFAGFMALFALIQPGFAQNVDEVINQYVEANGGMESLQKLNSVVKTGTILINEQELNVRINILKGKGFKMVVEDGAIVNYEVANEKEGHIFFPINGQGDAQLMDEALYRQLKLKMDLEGPFVNYQEKQHTVELAGVEEINGTIAYKLKLTTAEGDKVDYFIEKKSGYLIKTIYYQQVNGQLAATEENYSNFTTQATKLVFPYHITNGIGTINLTDVEVNVPVKETLFK